MFRAIVVLILSIALVSNCYAIDDLKIGVSDVKIGTMYDFNESQFLGVAYVSPLTYKEIISLDLGGFKDLDNIQESNISGIMIGLGVNLTEKQIPKLSNPSLCFGLGAGVEPNEKMNSDNFHYGVYGTFKVKFGK